MFNQSSKESTTCSSYCVLLNTVIMKGLTGSIEHHEDRPLLFLQQLPEVLKKSEREAARKSLESFIISKRKICTAHKMAESVNLYKKTSSQ